MTVSTTFDTMNEMSPDMENFLTRQQEELAVKLRQEYPFLNRDALEKLLADTDKVVRENIREQ